MGPSPEPEQPGRGRSKTSFQQPGTLPGCLASRTVLEWPAGANQQTELLLEEGALPEVIDKAMRDFGFAVGPCQVCCVV